MKLLELPNGDIVMTEGNGQITKFSNGVLTTLVGQMGRYSHRSPSMSCLMCIENFRKTIPPVKRSHPQLQL